MIQKTPHSNEKENLGLKMTAAAAPSFYYLHSSMPFHAVAAAVEPMLPPPVVSAMPMILLE